MDLVGLLTAAWEMHMAEYRAEASRLRATAAAVVIEAPFERSRGAPYARIHIADFIVTRGSGNPIRHEMPAGPAMAGTGTFVHAGVDVTVADLDWDRMRLVFEGEVPAAALAAVMEGWQWDPVHQRLSTAPGHIHAVLPAAGGLRVDMGTAPPEALLHVIEALGQGGIAEIAIRPMR